MFDHRSILTSDKLPLEMQSSGSSTRTRGQEIFCPKECSLVRHTLHPNVEYFLMSHSCVNHTWTFLERLNPRKEPVDPVFHSFTPTDFQPMLINIYKTLTSVPSRGREGCGKKIKNGKK